MLLSRRVQLAVLAHIRHTHTRYDELLRETSWQNARKVVEALCLDILVKWRGDEETGRDQLDEILREVVIISDSGSEESEEEDDTEDSSNDDMGGGQRMECDPPAKLVSQTMSRAQPLSNQNQPQADDAPILMRTGRGSDHALQHRTTARKEQRGFKRYRAWEEAIQRNRELELQSAAPETVGSASRGSQQYYGSTAHPPGPMAMDGGAGSVPEPNGFVPRQSHSSFPIAPLSNHSVRPPHDQVTSSVHDQTRTTPGRSRRITPVTDRFQDMLVRSIEPASPETTMQPSFVRALPPRPQPSPARHSVPFRAESTSPFRETVTRERPFYVDRRVVSDRPALDPPPQGHPGDPFGHQSAPRYYESRPVFHSPLSAAEPRSHQSGVASAPARRIAVGPCRPGERFNPILMEDRGGFFERVPAQLETTYSHPSNADMGSARWQPQASSRLPEPHGVVSWEEGSRILRESRNDRDVEVIPMSGPPTLPPGTQPHATPVGPHSTSDSYGLWAQRQPQGPGHHGQVVEPLPPRRDYMGALQEPHQGA